MLRPKCVKISEVYGIMTVRNGDKCTSKEEVNKWVENLKTSLDELG
jgi:hypothetical protein